MDDSPTPQSLDAGTEYVVLEYVNTPSAKGWVVFSSETARDGNGAIRQALEGDTDGGTYIAVPARSWKPVTVTPQTVTTLKFEETKEAKS